MIRVMKMNKDETAPVSLETAIRTVVGDAFELAGLVLFAVGLALALNAFWPLIVMGLILAIMGNLGDA